MELVIENENLKKALQLRKEGNPEALVWLEKACAERDSRALFFKAQALLDGGFFLKHDWTNAKRCYEQSAKAGCPWGMVCHGQSCDRDEERVWYAKALATNDDYACGCCFLNGRGFKESFEKARECLLRAAQQGNPFAQTLFGEQYMGKTNEENTFWLEKAAIFGDARAQFGLAQRCELGEGVEKSQENAFFWYLQGASQKHSSSLRYVADCYENGFGCEKNLPMSAVFYLEYGSVSHNIIRRLSAKFDDPIVRLQELFVYGRGLKKNAKLRVAVGEKKCANATRIYEQSTAAAKKAVLCFIWICKQTKCLNRDMQRMIGRMVFASREDPFVWNVGLEK